MAESVVAFLVDKLKLVIEAEAKQLSGIKAQVRDMIDDLESIQAFLKVADAKEDVGDAKEDVADAKEDGNTDLKKWTKDVREVAHKMEDSLDKFRVSYSNESSPSLCTIPNNLTLAIKRWKAFQQTSAELEDLSSQLRRLSEGRQRYKVIDQASSFRFRPRHSVQQQSIFMEDPDLIKIREQPKKQLIEMLMNKDKGRLVVSVFGMGGLGKSTLVKQVYDDPTVRKRFKVHAWITVSQSVSKNQLFKSIIHSIFKVIQKPPEEKVDTMSDTQLETKIQQLLQHSRYLIVLDDLWQIDTWNEINKVIPKNSLGGRVMITTRDHAVAQASCSGTKDMIHHLNQLTDAESRTLLYKKTFRADVCPPHLKNICDGILVKCQGLPLAIVAIGAVMAAKYKTDEWTTFAETLGVNIQENNQPADNTNELLYLSFNDLPYQLKSCFLYLSIFPDLYKIEHMRLIRLWLAEGFLIKVEGMTPEEVAESYLKKLMDRCLIQAAETATDGRVKSYHIHHLLREISISKSREQNFAAVETEGDTTWPERVRRLSIVNGRINRPPFPLRSLLMFGAEGSLAKFSLPKSYAKGLQLLTVLDLQGANIEEFPKEVVKLVLLKFLSLRGSKVKQIPPSIKNLRHLQTLDLKHSHVTELPAEILYLKQLRHLLVYRYEVESYAWFDSKYGVKVPAGICGLKNLQKLCKIEANQDDGALMAELKRMSQLRRLGILKLRKEDGKTLCFSIENMRNLHALSVSSVKIEEAIDLSHISNAPEFLQRIYLAGRLEILPHWISSLQNLVRLFLKWSRLKEDPLVHLQNLPNLVHLELLQVYDGESLHFQAGGFKKLELLGIDELEALQSVTIEEGAMPQLEKLIIQRCKCLKNVPSGIEHLTKLKLLEFFDMPDELIMVLDPKDGHDHWKVAGVPAVYYSYWKKNVGWDVYSLKKDMDELHQGAPVTRRLEHNTLWKV